MRISRPASTWPTTPRTASATIVPCVMARPSAPARYAVHAGVAELVRRARLKIGWPSGRAGSSPAPGIVEPLLTIAEDLERRDERAAEALLEVERLQAEVDELRAHAAAVASFLRELPGTQAALEAETLAAAAAHEAAAAAPAPPNASSRRCRSAAARARGSRRPEPRTDYLYATDFHNGRVDVFDGSFRWTTPGAFQDPNFPPGFAPFGIQVIGGPDLRHLRQAGRRREDDVAGQGSASSTCSASTASCWTRPPSRPLNAPWGLAIAPAGFGRSRRPARRQLRRRPHQRLPVDRTATAPLRGTLRTAATRGSRSMGSRPSASATTPKPDPPARCTSPPVPTTRRGGAFGTITAP